MRVSDICSLTTDTDDLTGTELNDTFTGVASSLSSARTLDATDEIDGAAGTDTLNADMQGNFTGFTGDGAMANVEIVNLTNEGSITRSFDATGVSGVEQYNLTGAVNLSELDALTTVTVADRTADLTIGFADEVTDGTDDSLALSVTDIGTADDTETTADEEDPVAITVAGVETTALTAEGTNVLDLSSVASEALTAEGSGSLNVTAVDAATKSIDASGMTGAVTLDVTAASDMSSIETGSADDTVTIDVHDDLIANASLAGGAGADDLIVTSTGADTVQYDQSGFETLSLGDLGGALTMSLTDTTDLETVVALGEAADAGDLDDDVTFANAGAGDLTFNLQGVNAETPTISSGHTGASTVVVDTPADAATTAAPSDNDVALTLTDTSSVNLSVAEKMSYSGVITAASATSIEAALTGAAVAGSAINAAAATSVVITSVDQDSELDLTTAAATEVNITNASDLDLTGSTLTAVEALTSTGAGALTVSALDALNAATISNTGAVVLGDVGDVAQDYALTVTSTGASSFDVGAMKTNNQNITLTVSEATGAVGAGAIDARGGDVTVTADTAGALTLDNIAGETVTIDASGVLGVTTGATTTVSGSLDFTGSELQNNTATAATTGTEDISLSFVGGIGDDAFTVNGGDDTTSVTVTGDFGIGTDTLAVDFETNATAADYSLDVTGVSDYDTGTFTLSGEAGVEATVSLGSGSDADTVAWSGAELATITGFDTTEDTLDFDGVVAGLTATATVTGVTAGGVTAAALGDDTVYVIDDGATALTGDGNEDIADYTDLTDVAAYLDEGYSATATDDAAVFVINDLVGDKTYAYSLLEGAAAADTIDAGDITLIGVVTEESGSALVAGDIA